MPIKKRIKRIKKKPIKKKVKDIEMYTYRILERDIDAMRQLAYIEAALKNEQQKNIQDKPAIIQEKDIAIPKEKASQNSGSNFDRRLGAMLEGTLGTKVDLKTTHAINPRTNKAIEIPRNDDRPYIAARKLEKEGYRIERNSNGDQIYRK